MFQEGTVGAAQYGAHRQGQDSVYGMMPLMCATRVGRNIQRLLQGVDRLVGYGLWSIGTQPARGGRWPRMRAGLDLRRKSRLL